MSSCLQNKMSACRWLVRLLDTLEHHGFLLRVPGTNRFGLHVACLIVGQAVPGSSVLVQAARPLLPQFAQRFSVKVLACVQERTDVLVLAQATAQGAPSGAPGAGMRVPLAGSALGHAWLWTQPAQVQVERLESLRSESGTGASQAAHKRFGARRERPGTAPNQA